MSRKSNRLKNRLRIETERAGSELKRLAIAKAAMALEAMRLEKERQDLNRSVALRMRVDREFARPFGDAWSLTIILHPQEYRMGYMRDARGGMQNASWYAAMKGDEAGRQIAQVIERCLMGELSEFEKAR